jgi:hypothetical protein
MSRCLILDTPNPGKNQQATALDATPPTVLDQARQWTDWRGVGNMAGLHPIAMPVPMNPDARQIIQACRDDMDARRDGEPVGSQIKPLWTRCAAIAEQLALIHACSAARVPSALAEISADSATWGVGVSTHLAQRMIYHIDRHLADGPFARAQLKLRRHIEDLGGWISDRDARRKMRNLKPRDFEDLIKSLMTQGRIKLETRTPKRQAVPGYAMVKK